MAGHVAAANVAAMSRIVVLGAGTGGTLAANRLRRACGDDVAIDVVAPASGSTCPGLIMANPIKCPVARRRRTSEARMEGIDANLFFTFFGLDAIRRHRQEHVKVATVDGEARHPTDPRVRRARE